ncbi:MAG TPA: phospholipase D-like domain-containing protein, partial [Ignavibacteria bacterium]|nr:phospholipase D-like domain-containing protein [Ignavibacteria bacterium]
MAKIKAKAYCSPNVVLLAIDWEEGKNYDDFLGFAIQRKPGFFKYPESWLPNRIGFFGPSKIGKDFPSNKCPIQKFWWWDSVLDSSSKARKYKYQITPVRGKPRNLIYIKDASKILDVEVSPNEKDGIGTYFNRAVVASQKFSKRFGRDIKKESTLLKALAWLADGLETVIPSFLSKSKNSEGAIYHLNDFVWIVPFLEKYKNKISIVYNGNDTDNDKPLEKLKKNKNIKFKIRTKAKIMHNKFIVRLKNGKPSAVLMGSANFTTAGLTTQANVLHTIESPKLAEFYLKRKRLLEKNTEMRKLGMLAKWSETISIGKSKVRVYFSPEKKPKRESLDTVAKAIKKAKKSVIFCLFSPTDKIIRDAIFKAGDKGLMMYGLTNNIPDKEPKPGKKNVSTVAKVEIYHRSMKKKDVYAHSIYPKDSEPFGFWFESANLPGKGGQFPVYIHHKFILIDSETDNPTIYTGSANISNASTYNN